ncbi:hypothetical protein [Methylobacterium sp. J-077]|uniref:hypothetical protein n=1 Tax=Methylobacterium sp. J-077 TaxID=2836656 RepID=UPI001FBBEA4A|nr:hypothetical protein [Methylobacterium sp. J-077]MCJ2124777.1 hypothetical protein [Methylobacterium sp. J-077]
MSFRTSLKNLIRRDAERPSLRERAAELRASIPASKPQAEPSAPEPTHADQVAQAGLTGDVLAVSGIDHRDGTVSYADATGKVSRRPMAHWVGFNAMQMHSHVQGEIGRRRILEANHLPGDAHEAWEARIRRELRSDAVHALAFRHDRAFEAAQAIRTGIEPATQALREQADAELLALAPVWEEAVDLYQRLSDEENLISETASEDGWPGPAPAGAGPEWRAWFQQKEDWRERSGVASAEEAASEAGTALHKIEIQIAELPAASLAGLRLKARVGQRSDDIGVEWPEGLSEGLARDILAFTEAQGAPPKPAIGTSLVDQIDFASASLEELQSLHDLADRVGSFAYALVWTGRCHTRGWDESKNPGDQYNAVGKLMQWLGDALTDVETAANDEARRRRPTTSSDRETRLEMLALPVIQNGDPDQTEAFARELLAHAEAERAGR